MLKHDGTVWATGSNTYGQLGVDTKGCMNTVNPIEVVSGGAKAVAAGAGHSIMLNQDGSVWSSGRNLFGQLGDGSHVGTQSFVRVVRAHAKFVAAGDRHSLVIMKDGSVWSTGYNRFGQLGDDGSTTERKVFVPVLVVSGGHLRMV